MGVVVTGAVKDYQWGMVDGMVPWTGRGTGKPQAELWFGAHPAGPSPTLAGVPAHEALGGHEVPLLVKILAAGRPLSIQVHPDAERAAAGFAAQGPAGSRYSDDKQKDEILVALSEFACFAGWRPPDEAAETLADLGYSRLAVDAAGAGDFVTASREVLRGLPAGSPWDPTAVAAAMGPVAPIHVAAISEIAILYPSDPGIGIAALLQYRRLLAGEAMYVPAGVPHAYVHGFGLEVMTSSDNVLRLGLTPKEIAIEDALAAVRPDRAPQVLTERGVKAPEGAPFRVLVDREVDVELDQGRYRVVVAIDGEVVVRCGGSEIELAIGQAFLCPASDPACAVSAAAMVGLVESAQERI